jgi:hypothetical protein
VTLEIAAPLALVCVTVLVLVSKLVIAPRRARTAVAAALDREGWFQVGPGKAPGWPALMALAVGRAAGEERDAAYDEKAGPFTQRVRRRERRTGRTLDLYRDASVDGRYAAVAVHEERTSTRTTMRSDRHHWVEHQFWIGEARNLRVAAPMRAFRWSEGMYREVGARMAAARDRDPGDVPLLAQPPADPLVDRVRAILGETDLAESIRADVYLAPGAWVLAAPLGTARSRVRDLLTLVHRVSAALDRFQAGH